MNKTIEVSAFVDRIQVFDNRRQSEVFHSNILGCGINLIVALSNGHVYNGHSVTQLGNKIMLLLRLVQFSLTMLTMFLMLSFIGAI